MFYIVRTPRHNCWAISKDFKWIFGHVMRNGTTEREWWKESEKEEDNEGRSWRCLIEEWNISVISLIRATGSSSDRQRLLTWSVIPQSSGEKWELIKNEYHFFMASHHWTIYHLCAAPDRLTTNDLENLKKWPSLTFSCLNSFALTPTACTRFSSVWN